jgi:hypothetical protein
MSGKTTFLMLIVMVAIGGVFFVSPIPQDQSYHGFVDSRNFFGVFNTFDVLSNLAFLLVGLFGVAFVGGLLRQSPRNSILITYLVFFVGVFLTSFGSAYYHCNPNNNSLVWDRLPMTIAFMAFFCSVTSELVNRKAGFMLLIPLLAVGIASVLYWDWTEQQGMGDRRLYGLVQFLPILLIPLMLCMYRSPDNYLRYIVLLICFYLASKIPEMYDEKIYELSRQSISGHTIKHLFAAAGACFAIRMIYVRKNALIT